MSTNVQDLAGLPPGETPRAIMLRHYSLVADARAKGWRWRAIAEALGLSEPSAKRAFWRVRRQIQLGRIDPEKLKNPSSAGKPGRSSRTAQPARQHRPQSEQTNTTTLAEMGVEIIGGDQQ